MKLTKTLAVAMLSMAAVSSVFAAGDRGRKSNGSCVENVYGTMGCEMASGRPQTEHCGCGAWNVSAGALYWHARVDGTEFAYSNSRDSKSLPINGSMKDMSFNWDWGFRLGAGYAFGHDGWDLNAEFSYFDSSGSKSTSSGASDTTVANLGAFGIQSDTDETLEFGRCDSAKSQTNVNYYDVTVELGRAQFNSKYLYFRPNFGLKGTWTDLSQTTRFFGGSDLDGNTVRIQDSQDWWGIGPRAGLNSKWFMGENFNLFGDVSFAALFGLFNVNHREKFSGSSEQRIRLRANKHGFTPYAQLAVGVAYETYLNDNATHLTLKAGYEVNYLWNQNQLLRVEDSTTRAQHFGRQSTDVAYHGISAKVVWEF